MLLKRAVRPMQRTTLVIQAVMHGRLRNWRPTLVDFVLFSLKIFSRLRFLFQRHSLRRCWNNLGNCLQQVADSQTVLRADREDVA